MLARLYILIAVLVLGAACTTQTVSQDTDAHTGATGPNGEAQVGLSAAALELDSPEVGTQVATRSDLWIQAGDDIRWCEVVEFPGEPEQTYAVERIEAMITPQGRELFVSAAVPNSATAALMEPGDRIPCNRAGEAFGEALQGVVSSQQSYLDQRYPADVGKRFFGGQRLVVEHHYENPTDEPVQGQVLLNFHTTDAEQVSQHVQLTTCDNLTIYTPPKGHSTHLGECALDAPIQISELGRRTRSFGTDFKVWQVDENGTDTSLLWHSADHRDNQYEFETPLSLTPGERLRFQCSYRNTSDRELAFGATTDDETCSLLLTYWDPTEPTPELKATPGRVLLNVDPDGIARNHHTP